MKDANEWNKKSSNLILAGIVVLFLAIVTLAVLYAVADKEGTRVTGSSGSPEFNDVTEITSSSNAFVYSDTMLCVIKEINSADKTVFLQNIDTGEEKLLKYSGGTRILDKYDNDMSASQLVVGLVVDAYYIQEEEKLVKLKISNDAWEYIGITGLIYSEENGIIAFNGQRYPMNPNIFVYDNEQELALSDLLSIDYVTVRGTENGVCVIQQTKGHGYLELSNDEDYIGGTIYVGTQVVDQIVSGMTIPVKEGTYEVTAAKGELTGTEELTITKNETTIFNLAQYSAPVIMTGLVRFKITPENATLYVDGVEQSYVMPVELSYGEHEIEVSMDGYVTYHGTIIVNSTDQSFQISLPDSSTQGSVPEEDDEETGGGTTTNPEDSWDDTTSEDTDEEEDWTEEDEDDDTSEDQDSTEDDVEDDVEEEEEEDKENSSGNQTTPGGVDTAKTLTISCTNGALVYIDGTYVGTITGGKLVCKKYVGTHTIELRLKGYSNKTYTIDLDNDGEDAVLNFPAFK